MAVKALLFDFDGTLLNTNELIIETFLHVLNDKFPGQYTAQDCLKFIGPSLKETFDELTPDESDEMVARYREWNAVHHDELVKGYDGVLETLEQLKVLGIRLALVTTKNRAGITRGLRVLGAERIFEHCITSDDVTYVKPHPEPVLLALEKLGVTKEEAIMIGDNSHDIEGGQNAGVRTAGVAWSIKGEDYIRACKPDFVLQHMTDLLDIVEGE